MARMAIKIDVVNLEPTKELIAELERVVEVKRRGATYEQAYCLFRLAYDEFKHKVTDSVAESEVRE